MNLAAAAELLGEHSRYFSEVYKNFSFKDEQGLKDYLDFIVHEPVEWLKGFPAKLKTANTFARPKTIMVKLLKLSSVRTALGEEYVDGVYDVVWNTYKKHAEAILLNRNKSHVASNVVEQLVEANELLTDTESVQADMDVDSGAAAPEPVDTAIPSVPAVPAGPAGFSDSAAPAGSPGFTGPAVPPGFAYLPNSRCLICEKIQFKNAIYASVLQQISKDYMYTTPGIYNAVNTLLYGINQL